MSHHTHTKDSSGGFWSIANVLIGLFIAGIALFWGAALVKGAIAASQKIRAPVEEATPAATPAAAAPTTPVAGTAPASATAAATGAAQELTLGPDAANPMLFNAKELKAKAGQPIKLTFDNSGSAAPLPHNVVVGKAGSKDALTQAATKIMTDPAGMAKGYVPEDASVIAAIKLVQPGAKDSVTFVLPAPGEYPYMCMFPGHSILMSGVLKAE
jgi:azurin